MVSALNSKGLVLSRVSCVLCHRASIPSWVREFFSWEFRGSKIFTRGYFMGLKLFLVSISWIQNFVSWVFSGSKILWFSISYFENIEKFLILRKYFVPMKHPREKFLDPRRHYNTVAQDQWDPQWHKTHKI